ncbi:hypothetical protein Q664_11940 [Archangium violaceum Cb vi76]|uniref:DUF1440 domain-containing protein n=2 Tax=Archangium violaceum TaxID=83451 RepID=A0A084SX05_9BACT|nr:hypothetical protein Q664_11940 [Archangium violaceum Cb vi76]
MREGMDAHLTRVGAEVTVSEQANRRIFRALGAGVLGTLALTASEPLRDALLGRPPPYSVRHIARRAARAWFGVRLRPREAQRWGLVMRWLYGPTLGVLGGWLRPMLPGPVHGLVLGGGVWLFEWLSFPRLRVTPPPHTWSPAERRWLAVQCLLFGLVTASVPPCEQEEGLASARPPSETALPVAPGAPLSPP